MRRRSKAGSCRSRPQAGAVASTDFARLMVKRLTHTGSTLRPRSVEFKGEIAGRTRGAGLAAARPTRKVAPVMDMIFPLTEAWRAHERMEEGEHIGKIMLDFVGSRKTLSPLSGEG